MSLYLGKQLVDAHVGSKKINISTKPSAKIVSWVNGTDKEVIDMLSAAYKGEIILSDFWNIGDIRPVTINGVSTGLRLINRGDKKLTSGGECQYVVEFVDCIGTTVYDSGTSGSVYTELYPGSDLDINLINIYNNSSSFLKNILKQWEVIYTEDVDGDRAPWTPIEDISGYSRVNTISRYLAAPAAYEIQGSGKWGPDGSSNVGFQCAPLVEDNAIEADGGQFDYYKNLGVKYNQNISYMIKKYNGSAVQYWGRSPCTGASYGATIWKTDGVKVSQNVSNSAGIAAIGCI